MKNSVWHRKPLVALVLMGAWFAPPSSASLFLLTNSSLAERSELGLAKVPRGWRKTRFGWEDATTWNQPETDSEDINRLIERTKSQQPTWIRVSFERISEIPPLWIAVGQVAAIALIVNLSKRIRVVTESP